MTMTTRETTMHPPASTRARWLESLLELSLPQGWPSWPSSLPDTAVGGGTRT